MVSFLIIAIGITAIVESIVEPDVVGTSISLEEFDSPPSETLDMTPSIGFIVIASNSYSTLVGVMELVLLVIAAIVINVSPVSNCCCGVVLI